MDFLVSIVWWGLFIGASASFTLYQLGRLGSGTRESWFRPIGSLLTLLLIFFCFILTGWWGGLVAFIAMIPVSVAGLLFYRRLRGDDI